jgi:hypothetical protein
MVDANYIASQLRGAWLIMLGKREGLRFLDVSEDGFWKSLQTVLIALPPLLFAWTTNSLEIAGSSNLSVISVTGRLALIEIVVWFLPLILLAYAARPLGFANQFVAFFVASNWFTAIINYLATPFYVLERFFPGADGPILIASLLILAMGCVFLFRVIRLTLTQTIAVSFAILSYLLVSTLLIVSGMESALGLVYPPASSG